MKLTLLLCALLLSAYGWCSSGPAHYTAAARAMSHSGTVSSYTDRNILSENHIVNNGGVQILVVWGCVLYLGALLWWTFSAKRKLDRTLEGVMESMGQYK